MAPLTGTGVLHRPQDGATHRRWRPAPPARRRYSPALASCTAREMALYSPALASCTAREMALLDTVLLRWSISSNSESLIWATIGSCLNAERHADAAANHCPNYVHKKTRFRQTRDTSRCVDSQPLRVNLGSLRAVVVCCRLALTGAIVAKTTWAHWHTCSLLLNITQHLCSMDIK